MEKKQTEKYWSAEVTKKSFALDLEEGVFTWKDPQKIARFAQKIGRGLHTQKSLTV